MLIVTQNCTQTYHQGPNVCSLVHSNLSLVWFLFWRTVFVLCYVFRSNFINLWIIFWAGYQGIRSGSCTGKRDSYTYKKTHARPQILCYFSSDCQGLAQHYFKSSLKHEKHISAGINAGCVVSEVHACGCQVVSSWWSQNDDENV
jgi:hypothetical protein